MSNYLALTDFTKAAENALISALNLAKKDNGKVTVLHVLESNGSDLIKKAEEKIVALRSSINGSFHYKIIVGKLLKIIDKLIDELHIDYVVLGTHGVIGIQKVLGSNALKLVNSTKKPFLITQVGKTLDQINNIVLPFSFSSESIQIGKVVAMLATTYNAKVHLVGYRDNDEWLKNDMVRNQAIIKGAFKAQNANFEIVKLQRKGSFEKQLLEFAESIDADLIAAGYFNGSRLIIRKNFVRDMISNKLKIPVLTLNAESLKNIGNFGSI